MHLLLLLMLTNGEHFYAKPEEDQESHREHRCSVKTKSKASVDYLFVLSHALLLPPPLSSSSSSSPPSESLGVNVSPADGIDSLPSSTVHTSISSLQGLQSFVRAKCAMQFQVVPRFAVVAFGPNSAQILSDFISCENFEADPLVLFTRMETWKSKVSHANGDQDREQQQQQLDEADMVQTLFSNLFALPSPSHMEKLQHLQTVGFEKKSDVHLVFTPMNDTAVSVEYSNALLSLASQPRFTMSIFIDTTKEAAKNKFGDPQFANVYGDGSHFNKAFTLKRLIKAGDVQASSLQSHFLAKGE